MTLKFDVPGKRRKELSQAISSFLGEDCTYKGAPSFVYEIGRYTIDKDGNLSCSDLVDINITGRLVEFLLEEGFDVIIEATEDSSDTEITGICISMPRSHFTESNLENLKNIIAAKHSLICKALGTDNLPLEITGTKVSFPWFPGELSPENVKVYDTFICKLCKMACNQKRTHKSEKTVDNEKYAFRCFLLRLGFIGDEYKTERKILLKNLTGSSAFKGGAKKEVSGDEISK